MKKLMRLDCETSDSAALSLARFSGLSSDELLAKLDEFSESDENKLADCERWEALAERLSVPTGSFEVCWFHGTRTANPESFITNGILPLQQRLDGIWNELALLIADRVDATEAAGSARENYVREMDRQSLPRPVGV
jgi:hypothetical protein